jgi:succinyl-CoA synthetase alpha subunit
VSVLVGRDTRLLVQGITGKAAGHHTRLMLDYGTTVVAGARPGAGGQEVHGVPVFDTVAQAVRETEANASILFVPARAMRDAAFEAMRAGVRLLVMVSEHVPLHDAMEIVARAEREGADVVGPNTPGMIAPALGVKIGFVPSRYYAPGSVGVASRSGTLTYEIVSRLTLGGIGQSTCVGVGGDPVVGTTFTRMARLFAYIAGRTAPEGKRMGHAGAIVAGGRGSIKSKLRAFEVAGIPVAEVPDEVADLVRSALTSSA